MHAYLHKNVWHLISKYLQVSRMSLFSSMKNRIPMFLNLSFNVLSGLLRMLTVQPHLISDKGYLERSIRYAIDCGVIDQWKRGRVWGFPPKEGLEEEVPDPNGIRSITEMEYRTLEPAS